MTEKMIIDISITLMPGMSVYPGNPGFLMEPQRGKSSIHSKLFLGSHIGTHVDAPRHVFEEGKGVDQMSLNKMIGPCRVLDFTDLEDKIDVGDLEAHHIQPGEKILAKTKNSQRGFDGFYDDYIYLGGDASEYLAKQQIDLFGIDSFSVKQRGGSDCRPHNVLLEKGIVIVEGLDLSQVESGEYELIVLPLKIKDGDGAPARAVLISN